MPLYALRKEQETIRRVEDPGCPDTWPNAMVEENTRLLADRYWYCEQVTEDNPETGEDGTPMAIGNYCMWFRWFDGTYRKTESQKDFFEQAYINIDELPEEKSLT